MPNIRLSCDPQKNSSTIVQVHGGQMPVLFKPTEDVTMSIYRSEVPVFSSSRAVTIHSAHMRVVADPTVTTAPLLDVLDTDPPFNEAFYYILVARDEHGKAIVIDTIDGCPTQYEIPVDDNIENCVPILFSDPAYPNMVAWAGLLSIDPLSYPARRELYEPYGRAFPVAVSNVRGGPRTTIRVLTRTRGAREDMLQVLASGSPVCVRMVDPEYPESLMYISIGDVTEERIFPDHRLPERIWVMDVAVVQRPLGGPA
jgi:hypothetical protein